MSLYENAIESIEVGVEDYESPDPGRAASAVRNFFAGVLLLLKEKLRLESPSDSGGALIYSKIVFKKTSKGVMFFGSGKNTVDVQQVIERFNNLCLSLNHAPLKRLQEIRNDVEHGDASKHSEQKMQEAIANTFALVTQVLIEHLGKKPAQEFREHIWNVMLNESNNYALIENQCMESFDRLTDVHPIPLAILRKMECDECGSSLIKMKTEGYLDGEIECCSCGRTSAIEDIMPALISSKLAGQIYEAYNDGSDPPIATCETCLRETWYVLDDTCLLCGEVGSSLEDDA